MTLSAPDTIPALTASLAAALADQTRSAISSEGNVLLLPDSIGEDALRHIIARMGAMHGSTEKLDAVLRYNIGRAVMHLAACGPVKRDLDEVIDEADLPKLLGRSAKTISNWAYVARTIPPEELKPVSWTVLSEAAAAPPKDPKAAMEWKEKREKLLEEAADAPESFTAKKVREKVKEIQTELLPPNPSTGAEKPVKESIGELMSRYVKLERLMNTATQADLRLHGIDTHGVCRDLLSEIENELINRDALSADPCKESIYWIKKNKEE
jgi:hypothetical protein